MTTDSKKHYPLSPSAAHRWLVCPGEVDARKSAPYKTSGYAKEGTTAHWVAEQALGTLTHLSPRDFIKAVCPETGQTVTADMVDAVEVYTEHCLGLMAGSDWTAIEIQYTLPEISDDLGGTSDFNCLKDKTLYVRDYKHGKGYEVEVKDNPQLLLYALGSLYKLACDNPKLAMEVRTINMGVVQPRTNPEPQIWEISRFELIQWQEDVLRPAIRAVAERSHERHGGKHCRFCPVKATCPETHSQNLSVAKLDFSEEIPAVSLTEIPFERLVEILKRKDQIVDWLNGIEAHVHEQLEKGLTTDAFKLVRKKSNRQWAAGQEEAVKAMLGKDAYTVSLISPAQAEKILKRAFDLPLPPALVDKPDTGLVLAPADDKRPGVDPKAAMLADFSDGLLD